MSKGRERENILKAFFIFLLQSSSFGVCFFLYFLVQVDTKQWAPLSIMNSNTFPKRFPPFTILHRSKMKTPWSMIRFNNQTKIQNKTENERERGGGKREDDTWNETRRIKQRRRRIYDEEWRWRIILNSWSQTMEMQTKQKCTKQNKKVQQKSLRIYEEWEDKKLRKDRREREREREGEREREREITKKI